MYVTEKETRMKYTIQILTKRIEMYKGLAYAAKLTSNTNMAARMSKAAEALKVIRLEKIYEILAIVS